jgi:hypothetical protein
MNLLDEADRKWMSDVVNECDPDLVIVDVLREVHNAEENDSTAMKIVGDVIMYILRERSVVILHHIRKPGIDEMIDPVNAGRGSSYLAGKVDILWLLQGSALHIVSRVSANSSIPMYQDPKTGLWRTP